MQKTKAQRAKEIDDLLAKAKALLDEEPDDDDEGDDAEKGIEPEQAPSPIDRFDFTSWSRAWSTKPTRAAKRSR